MSRSLAPSPTATTRDSGTSPAHSRRWRSLAARSTTGPVVRPVRRPSATSRRLAATWSMPSSAASGSTISRNPPETSPTRPPRPRTSATSSRAPAESSTAARTSSSTATSRPASVATRSRRLAAKSSSPRIARSVTSATCSRVPACSASSSMTSAVMSVESTSMTSRPTPSATSAPLVTPTSTPSAVAGPRSSAASARSASGAVPGRAVPSRATPDQPGRDVGEVTTSSATVDSTPRAWSTSDGGTGRAETRPIRMAGLTPPGYVASGSAPDRRTLRDDRDAGLGDPQAALHVELRVHAHLGAVGDAHVLVHDRAVHDGVAADVDVVEEHRVPHRGPGVDLRAGRDDRAHDLPAGDDDAGRDEGVQRVPQPLPVPVDELRRRQPGVAREQRPLLVVEVEHRGDGDEVLVGVVVGVDRADVAPVAAVALGGAGDDVVLEVVHPGRAALDEPRHEAAAHVVLGVRVLRVRAQGDRK